MPSCHVFLPLPSLSHAPHQKSRKSMNRYQWKKKKKAEKGRGHQISANRGVHTQPRVFCFSCCSASWQHFTLSLFSFGRFVACTTTPYCVFTVQIPYKRCRASPGLPCHLCFPWQSVCSELFLIFNKSSYLFPYGLVLYILRAWPFLADICFPNIFLWGSSDGSMTWAWTKSWYMCFQYEVCRYSRL